jgi:hypothetical protein
MPRHFQGEDLASTRPAGSLGGGTRRQIDSSVRERMRPGPLCLCVVRPLSSPLLPRPASHQCRGRKLSVHCPTLTWCVGRSARSREDRFRGRSGAGTSSSFPPRSRLEGRPIKCEERAQAFFLGVGSWDLCAGVSCVCAWEGRHTRARKARKTSREMMMAKPAYLSSLSRLLLNGPAPRLPRRRRRHRCPAQRAGTGCPGPGYRCLPCRGPAQEESRHGNDGGRCER